MALKTSIDTLKEAIGQSLQNVPAVVESAQRALTEVSTQAGDVDTAVSDVGTLKTRMTTAEGKIETLEGYTVYSETEHIVGKWIDGNDVFEKVINFGTLPNTTSKEVDHNITNLGYVVDYTAIADNGTNKIKIPYATTTFSVSARIIINNYKVTIQTSSDFTSYTECKVIIRYTKSTEPSRQPDDEDVKPDEPIEK